MKKKIKFFNDDADRCWFLLIMSYLSFCLLVALNIYIAYRVIQSFFGDGWSFLGGFIIAASYIVTIPALIFSALSIRMIRYDNNKKYVFPIILGVIGILTGIILNNATGLWIYIIVFNVLLLGSCLICGRNKQKRNDNEPNIADTLTPKKITESSTKEVIKNVNPDDNRFKIVKAFQITGLVLLFLLFIALLFSPGLNEGGDKGNQSIFFIAITGALFFVNLIATIDFFRKRKWALNFYYYETYILLMITVLLAMLNVMAEKLSFTKSFFLIVFIFALFIFIFSYLIESYKKLKMSKMFA